MSLGLLPDDLLPLLSSQKLGPEWVTMIWDSHGAILARSPDNARYIDKLVPQNLREHAQRAIVRTTNLDRADVLHATGAVAGFGLGHRGKRTILAHYRANAYFAAAIGRSCGSRHCDCVCTKFSLRASDHHVPIARFQGRRCLWPRSIFSDYGIPSCGG